MKVVYNRLFPILFSIGMLLVFNNMVAQSGWTPMEPPPDARSGHSLVTLPDGRVVMFGGQGEDDTIFNDLNIFLDTWTPITPVNDPPEGRKFHNAWAVEDKLYVHGGVGATKLLDDIWSYDFNSSTWEQLEPSGDIPEARQNASSFIWNGKLFLLSGQGEEFKLSDVWGYNTDDNSWSKWGHSPASMADVSAFQYHDQLYVFNNFDWMMHTDLNNKQWRDFQPDPKPTPRLSAASTTWDHIAYLIGGEGSILQDAWSFDMATETWTQLADIPIPIKHAAAAIYDNQILLVGGEKEDGTLNDQAWAYRFAPSSAEDQEMELKYNLANNYPNPFNPSTKIKYSISEQGIVKLSVYSILGEEIEVLVNELQNTGEYEIQFDGMGLTSGIYFYNLRSGDFSQTKKMLLLQ